MKAHDLARQLLAGPDTDVVVIADENIEEFKLVPSAVNSRVIYLRVPDGNVIT